MKFSTAILPLLLAQSVHGQVSTWMPGDFSDGKVVEDAERGTKIFLSNGLMGKAIAWDGEPVMGADGTQLADSYHKNCDGGATFPKADGGYYYVSNSEIGDYPNDLSGGAYSLEFTADHELVGYKQVLGNTAKNCHGGATPWNTWVSCEEHRQFGQCWQVDPSGTIEPRPTALTALHNTTDFGNWEAFAWDSESSPPRGYVTNDDFPEDGLPAFRGAIVRFTPDATAESCLGATADAEKWCAMESGTHDFLKLIPASEGASTGTFEWVTDVADANPELYGGSEGAHVEKGILTFSTVMERYLFRLNLNDMTFVRSAIPFEFEPDNLRILNDVVYLCTDGDHNPHDSVFGWDDKGAFRLFYEEGHNYPAGVDFTPDNMMMYVSMYGEATWQFWREDGLAFDAPVAGIKYEKMGGVDDGKTHEEIGEMYVTTDGSSHDEAAKDDHDDHDHDDEGTEPVQAGAASSATMLATTLAGALPFAAMF